MHVACRQGLATASSAASFASAAAARAATTAAATTSSAGSPPPAAAVVPPSLRALPLCPDGHQRHDGLFRRGTNSHSGPSTRRFFATDSKEEEVPFLKRKAKQAHTRDGIPLPPGWREEMSNRGPFYVHAATGVTQTDYPYDQPTKEQVAQAFNEKHGEQVSKLRPGIEVELVNLKFGPHLNGKKGILQGWDPTPGMVRVRMHTGELKAVKQENCLAVELPKKKTAYTAPPKEQQTGKMVEDKPFNDGFDGRKWVLFAITVGSVLCYAGAYWDFKADMADREAKEKEAKQNIQLGLQDEEPSKLLASAGEVAAANYVRRRSSKGAKASTATTGPEDDPSKPPTLPADWHATWDPSLKRFYFWKASDPTGTVTWEKPALS